VRERHIEDNCYLVAVHGDTIWRYTKTQGHYLRIEELALFDVGG
jgi:hypothetical protein